MATHAPAWMPFAHRQHPSHTFGDLSIPFISTPPSVLHYSLLGFRGSSAPPVLSHPPNKSPKNTFTGHFHSNKVRPSSSYAESGPYNQRSRQEKNQELANMINVEPLEKRSQTVSRDSSEQVNLTDLHVGRAYVYSPKESLPLGSRIGHSVTRHAKGKGTDEKTFVNWQESPLTDGYAQHSHLVYVLSDYEPARPRSFPYFLPMPLKRLLSRHTWTDYDDQESFDDIGGPSASTSTNINYRISQNLQTRYEEQTVKIPDRQWRGILNEPSPAPSSDIMDNMHRNVPTVSSLSLSEISLDKPRKMPHILSSPYQMADINAVEKGFSYRPSPSKEKFWNDQTLLFMFGFLFFPFWWIGAFKAVPLQTPKMYNAYYRNAAVTLNQEYLHRPPARSPSPIIPIRPNKTDLISPTKGRFQQLNRIMTVISMVLLLFAAGLLIWYGIGF